MGDGTQEEGWVVCRIFKKKNHHKTLDSPISSSLSAETRNHMLMSNSCNEGALEHILEYMGRNNCKEDSEPNNINSTRFLRPIETAINNNGYPADSFMKLPSLDSPNSTSSQNCYQPMMTDNEGNCSITNQVSGDPNNSVYNHHHHHNDSSPGLTNWAALDRLVASQLNGQTESSRQLACFSDHSIAYCNPTDQPDLQLPAIRSSSISSNRSYHGTQDHYNSEIDLWSFTRSSSSSLSSSVVDPLCHVVNASV
ncbi:hypothetical protein CCACVL1_21955 [Corchorus capsularis]|uniref:No apical meristem (NAM) protein n=1 Tax=Corchorus capsularis TaxID=210143 RepID=A0A1R3H1J7_COCAP|nr:hypothetical protein CCACVL1_21955 [Corchorus capsularis]